MAKYNTVAEAYGFWKNSTVPVMEARAKALEKEIAENPDADVAAYAIEAEALEQAISEKRGAQVQASANPPAEVAATAKAEGDGEGAASKVYRSAFYKHLQGHKLTQAEQAAFDNVNAELRANAFNKLSDTSAVIPTQTLNEIIVKARDMGGIMGISRGFNMPANISVPVATPGEAASWHTEGASVETEKVTPASVTFGAFEIMRVLSISAAVRTMSIGAFESYLADELTASVMACLGKAMVNGTGTNQGKGVISGITWTEGTNKITVGKGDSLVYENILQAISLLHRGYSNGAAFVMNNATLYTDVYGLVDDNAQPIYVQDLTKAGAGRILGFPVVIDDYMEDHDILFGNFHYNGYNIPSGIALDVSRDSSFTKGLVDYRAMAIADCKPIVDEAFVYVTKATA